MTFRYVSNGSTSNKLGFGINNVGEELFSIDGAGDCAVLNDLSVGGDIIVPSPTVPASAGATGTAGTIAWASGFIYVCVAANTWQRAALATW